MGAARDRRLWITSRTLRVGSSSPSSNRRIGRISSARRRTLISRTVGRSSRARWRWNNDSSCASVDIGVGNCLASVAAARRPTDTSVADNDGDCRGGSWAVGWEWRRCDGATRPIPGSVTRAATRAAPRSAAGSRLRRRTWDRVERLCRCDWVAGSRCVDRCCQPSAIICCTAIRGHWGRARDELRDRGRFSRRISLSSGRD